MSQASTYPSDKREVVIPPPSLLHDKFGSNTSGGRDGHKDHEEHAHYHKPGPAVGRSWWYVECHIRRLYAGEVVEEADWLEAFCVLENEQRKSRFVLDEAHVHIGYT